MNWGWLGSLIPANGVNRENMTGAVTVLVTGLAVVWFAFEAAALTWTILDEGGDERASHQPEQAAVLLASRQHESTSVAHLNDIIQYHLFGRSSARSPALASTKGEVNAPKTRLNLKLRGLFAAERGAFAIIAAGKGEEQVYKVGMMVNPSTKIDAINVDSVVLNRGGRLEVLYLEDEEQSPRGGNSNQRSSSRSATPALRYSRPGESSGSFGAYRERFLKNPQEAMRFAKIQPVMVQGKMSGYRVRPGSDPKLFEELGFKSGDLVKEINGIAVDDPTKIGNLMSELTSAQQLSVTLERRGQIEHLLIEF